MKTKRDSILFAGVGVALCLLAACFSQHKAVAGATKPIALPGQIALREPGLYPEDVEWDGRRGRFLVSSVSRGLVSVVEDDGHLRALTDGQNIKSAIGIHLDPARNRLLVAGADFSALSNPKIKGEAKLAIYNLTTGKRERLVDLAALHLQGRHLANDVTLDARGNAYITDSFSPLIYRVTPGGQASVFLNDPRLESRELNLNGIAYHPGGFLLVAVGSRKALYRIPINAPNALTRVRMPEPIFADSLTFRSKTHLIVAVPFAPGIVELSSDDDWHSARVVGRVATSKAATTTSATLRAGAVYGLNSHFAAMGQKQPVQAFEIFRANLR